MAETESVTILEVALMGMLGMFFLALTIVAFFILYQNRLLKQQKNHQAVEEEYQRELLVSSIKSQEQERHRIAIDLHDEIGAMLTTTKLYTDQIDLTESYEELTELKNKTNTLLDETIDNVRRISSDLRPVILENFGLLEAIENLKMQVNNGNKTVMHTLLKLPVFNADEEMAIYRIVKELVNNTLKHGQASEIHLKGLLSTNLLTIEYSDDGLGFDPYVQSSGLGLKSIESRVKLLKGFITYKKVKNGMRIQIEIRINDAGKN